MVGASVWVINPVHSFSSASKGATRDSEGRPKKSVAGE